MCPDQNTREFVATWRRQRTRVYICRSYGTAQSGTYRDWYEYVDRQETDSAVNIVIFSATQCTSIHCAKESVGALKKKKYAEYVDMQDRRRTAAYVHE